MSERSSLWENTLWTGFANLALGFWLLLTPLAFVYGSNAMLYNDLIVAIVLIFCSVFSLSSKHRWAPWIICLFGVWLQFAPLVFWAPKPFLYLNDTIVGVLAIAFSVLIPKTPEEITDTRPSIPPGWNYNPSSWTQRVPIVLIGLIGWLFARYMATYQLGYLPSIFDPFFGEGTFKVITSDVSHAFPISDAGLGAAAYTLEALWGCQGGVRRWYTMPWSVVVFGLLVVPLGITSVVLVILQPVVVGYWCFWCLLVAIAMLLMVALAINEVVAVLQFLNHSVKRGDRFWTVFWKGGEPVGAKENLRSPLFSSGSKEIFPSMLWGVNFPWNLIVTAVIGGWLMFSPPSLGMTALAADNSYIIGSLTLVISVISFAEVVRAARWINGIFGLWLLCANWFFVGSSVLGMISCAVSGVALIFFSRPRGKVKESYGTWDSCIF